LVPWCIASQTADRLLHQAYRRVVTHQRATRWPLMPIFTKLAAGLRSSAPSAKREDSRCLRFASRDIASNRACAEQSRERGDERQRHEIRESRPCAPAASGTRAGSARSHGPRLCPEQDGSPSRAERARSGIDDLTQRATGSLFGEMSSAPRPSCRPRPAVPGVEPLPASRKRAKTSAEDWPEMCQTCARSPSAVGVQMQSCGAVPWQTQPAE